MEQQFINTTVAEANVYLKIQSKSNGVTKQSHSK